MTTRRYAQFRHALHGDRPLVLDGATGTVALGRGLAEDRNVAALNLVDAEAVTAIHRAYIGAGADIISTNTFCADRLSQSRYGFEDKVTALNEAGVRLALAAAAEAGGEAFVAGTIGPAFGASREDVEDAMAEQAEALVRGGADLLLVETVMAADVLDATLCAISRVCRERGCDIPVVVSMYVDCRTGRLADGHSPQDILDVVRDFEPEAVGFNCGDDPEALLSVALRFAEVSPYPLLVYPSAGLPDSHGRYGVTPSLFADAFARFLAQCRPGIIGGCCGTTPAHIAALAEKL